MTSPSLHVERASVPKEKPAVVKKKRSSKKKLPTLDETPKSNRLDRYMTSSATSKSSNGNFTTPKPIRKSNVPGTVSTVDSSQSQSTISVPTPSQSTISVPTPVTEPKYRLANDLPFSVNCSPEEIRPSAKCNGCKLLFKDCIERKYRDYCLQAVLTHIDQEGMDLEGCYGHVTDFSVRKVYHNEYMSQVRRDLKEATGYYESNHMLHIPLCMMTGSLKDALAMANGKATTLKQYLLQQRVYDIAQRKKDEEDERLFLESGKRIADEEDFMDEVRRKRRKEQEDREE